MAKTVKEILDEARSLVREVSAQEVKTALDGKADVLLVDVREKEEYREGHIEGAVSLPRGFLELRAENVLGGKSTPIIAYCAGGTRSLLAARVLKEMGWVDVVSMAGGFNGWKNAGYPWIKEEAFTPEQLERYSRHFLLREVGESGQRKLLAARVLLIGAGGLGSPAALYLGAAGVGTLGIVDHDVVDRSNLQRQVLHNTERVGMAKTESARMTLEALNPDVKVIEHRVRLSSANALEILRDYDIVVDGCDNFPTRYLTNDACVMLRKPNVHGSIFQFEGMASVFYPPQGPCYRCLYPQPPPPGAAPSCAEAGVLGVLPGLVGTVQALETIKLILGVGEPLIGKMAYFDTLSMDIRMNRIRRDPQCPVCGEHPTIEKLIDYEEFCAMHQPVRRRESGV